MSSFQNQDSEQRSATVRQSYRRVTSTFFILAITRSHPAALGGHAWWMTDCNRTGHLLLPLPPPPVALIHPPLMSTLSEVAPGGWVAPRLMATGLAGREHLSAQKNMMARDERGGEVQGGRAGGCEGVGEGPCIRHAPVLSSYGAIY